MSPQAKKIFSLAVAVLGLAPVFAAQNVSAADSITVTIDGQTSKTIALDIAARHANGTFVKSANSIVAVTTTNATGYTLGIKASGSNPTKLINSSDSDTDTNYLKSITAATTEAQFKALAGTAYNGMWGYLPSKHNSAANTSFLPAPSATGDTIDETTTANTTANEYTLAIGARVDASQKLGSYSNTYVVYANANAIPYTIVYDDNVVTDMPVDVNDGKATGGTFSIDPSTPKRSGYKFIGWCTVSTATDQASCTAAGGQFFTAGQSVTISAATDYKLYAIWGEVTKIQDFTLSMCQSQASDGNVTVVDSRDGKDYTVRYINGACWMTQNLAIEPGTTMTKDDTNIAADSYTLPGSGYDLKDNGASGGNCYGSGTSGAGYTNACTHVANDTDVSDANNQYTKEQLGAWYNYMAATAGTISGTSNSTVDTYNICPKGWTLPANGTSAGQIGSVTSYKDAFSPLYGGNYSQGSHRDATTYGYWWSATAYYAANRYFLGYSNGSLYTYNDLRFLGYYVRCVRTS